MGSSFAAAILGILARPLYQQPGERCRQAEAREVRYPIRFILVLIPHGTQVHLGLVLSGQETMVPVGLQAWVEIVIQEVLTVTI